MLRRHREVHFPFMFLLALLVGAALMPAPARGDIYVANYGNGKIGEYTLAGGVVNSSLISGLNGPNALAMSGSNLFVANYDGTSIGEYNTAGGVVNASLVSGFMQHGVCSLAVSGSYLFVSSNNPSTGSGTIGEYNALTGATINASLISGLVRPQGIALSGSDLYVASDNSGLAGAGTVGKYTLSADFGSITSSTPALITGLSYPETLAISGTNLFVVNEGVGAIAEYNTSGQPLNTTLITGLNNPIGIALLGSDMYVTNFYGTASIGKYTLGADSISIASSTPALVSGLSNAHGIVVTPEPATLSLLAFGAVGLLIRRSRK